MENNKKENEEKKIRKLSDIDSNLLQKIKEKYQLIKKKSGSHSPGAYIIEKEIPEIKLSIDCCFLSNPYATEIFEKKLKESISNEQWLYGQIESYPAQNAQIAEYVSKAIGIKPENIFIGNGATEIISALLNRFIKGKILIMLPTFSPFYEYVNTETTKIHYYPLTKEKDRFTCDIDRLLIYCNVNEINNIVVINPNNPDGSLIEKATMKDFLERFSFMDNILLDETFIEYAPQESIDSIFYEYSNVTIIRSMSKIFGISGIRAGYCITKADYVKDLLENGFLWNSNCFAIYFFGLLNDNEFMKEYQEAKDKYIKEMEEFEKQLENCNPKLRFYKSKANIFLGEILDKNKTAEDLMFYMLIAHGIYIRDCGDKKGLNEKYFRISCRKSEENKKIIEALKMYE